MKRLLLPLALAVSLNAYAYSGKELLADCQAAEAHLADQKPGTLPSLQAMRCLSYVTGFADGYGVADRLAGKVEVQLNAFCLPEEDDRSYRLVRAVVTHLERQPPNTSASTGTLVAGALSKAFPCP